MLRFFLTLTLFRIIIVLKIRMLKFCGRQGENMAEIGVIKEIDRLGRIVIPKELRKRYGLTDQVELIATEKGILLKSQEYVLCEIEKHSLK